MGQVLHGSAHTTEAVRRAIQRSEASVRALAKRHGISPTTVQKWRKRATVTDAPMGPKSVRSTVLAVEEEAMVVAFRRHTLSHAWFDPLMTRRLAVDGNSTAHRMR